MYELAISLKKSKPFPQSKYRRIGGIWKPVITVCDALEPAILFFFNRHFAAPE